MSYYPAGRSLEALFIGAGNMSAKASNSVGDTPDHSVLTDSRIKTWNDFTEEWTEADSGTANGSEDAGGSGLLIPQIALEAIKHGATGLRFVSIAASSTDIHDFDPASVDLLANGLNRWDDGLSKVRRSGLEPDVLIVNIGEGDGTTILTKAQIKAHHQAIVTAAVAAWASLRRIVDCVPPLRRDEPVGTQTARGELLQAIAEVADESAIVRAVDLAKWNLRKTGDANYPFQTVTECGEIAKVIEPECRL